MMETQKVAVVTGANKGIGFAIVKGLCEKYEGIVYLTARDLGRGEAAVLKLKELGLKPLFHQLDINDQSSVDKLRDHLLKTHGGLDLLVNNAAIAFKKGATNPFGEQAETTVAVNYFSLLRVCETLFPILRQNARVVHLSSSAGHLSKIPSTDLRSIFKNTILIIPELNKLMNQFVKEAKEGTNEASGWGDSAYVVSKVGVNCLTQIQHRVFQAEQPNRNISVNSVHPGHVDTDMTSHKGPLTIEEGASSPLYLALDAPQNLKGKYVWCDKKAIPWDTDSYPA